MAIKKRKGHLSKLAQKRSAAAKKGWLTRKANQAALRRGAKERTPRKPIFEEPITASDIADWEAYEDSDDWEDVMGIDSLYAEE